MTDAKQALEIAQSELKSLISERTEAADELASLKSPKANPGKGLASYKSAAATLEKQRVNKAALTDAIADFDAAIASKKREILDFEKAVKQDDSRAKVEVAKQQVLVHQKRLEELGALVESEVKAIVKLVNDIDQDYKSLQVYPWENGSPSTHPWHARPLVQRHALTVPKICEGQSYGKNEPNYVLFQRSIEIDVEDL